MNVVAKFPSHGRVSDKADHFSPQKASQGKGAIQARTPAVTPMGAKRPSTDPVSSPTQLSAKDRTVKPHKKKIFKPGEEPKTFFENAQAKEGQKPAKCKKKKRNMLKWKIKSSYIHDNNNEERCSGPVAGEDGVETSGDSATGTTEDSKGGSPRLAEIRPASKKQEEKKTEKTGQEEKKKETNPKAAKPATKKNMEEPKKQEQGGGGKDDAKKKELDAKKKTEDTAKKAEQMKKEKAELVKKKESGQIEKKEDPTKKAENANKKEVPAKKPAEDAAKKDGDGKPGFFHGFTNIFKWR